MNLKHVKYPWEVGDILWVRETWNDICWGNSKTEYWYKADEPIDADTGVLRERWRPSIFMPRAAARLFLKVISIRVERLQDISEADAISEGIKTTFEHRQHHDGSIHAAIVVNHIRQFADLWNGINYKRGYGWGFNPWVWVLEFERIEAKLYVRSSML